MTLEELIADLKAAGANENTMQLAINCYELGLKNATEVERSACAKVAEDELGNTSALLSMPPKSAAAWNIMQAIRARGQQ